MEAIAEKSAELSCPSSDDDVNDEWDGYEPTISDRLHVGFYRMDRACQTDESDLVNLQQLSDLLGIVVQDIMTLKKNLNFAKLTLQAEYDGRLHDELTALYCRINQRIAEIEEMHEQRIVVLRRSYRTQLSNALCKLSCDYHRYYGKKDAELTASHNKRLSEMEVHRTDSRKNEIIHKEIAEMLKVQAADAVKHSEEEYPVVESAISVSKYTEEILELNETVTRLEGKIEYLEEMLDETNEDNAHMNDEVDCLTVKLNDEEEKNKELKEEISALNKKIIKERFAAQERLNQQKEKLKTEMDSKVRATRQKLEDESTKQVEELKKLEADKLFNQKLSEERKIQELLEKQDEEPVKGIVDQDTAHLLSYQQSQQEEIIRLRKELDQKSKMWQMKAKILQEHVHVLKNEMFLRTTLQRQSAKMRQAGLTYARKGAYDIPLGVHSTEENRMVRKHLLPTIVHAPKLAVEDKVL